jgi:hypothetical protein
VSDVVRFDRNARFKQQQIEQQRQKAKQAITNRITADLHVRK